MKPAHLAYGLGGVVVLAWILSPSKASATSKKRAPKKLRNCPPGFVRRARKCQKIQPDLPPPPKPKPVPVPEGAPPGALVEELCHDPLRLEPGVVGQILADYAVPAYRVSTGGEFAPSESQKDKARAAVVDTVRGLCMGQSVGGLAEVASQFARAAEAIDASGRYGQLIESETATGRICNWDGKGGTPLDTTQTIALIVDVVFDGLRRHQNRDAIAKRIVDCSQQTAPVSATSSLALAYELVDVGTAVREAVAS